MTKPSQHEVMLRTLFRESFGSEAPQEWYAWKYDHMQGRYKEIFDQEGKMLAHYAGFPRRMIGTEHHQQGRQSGDADLCEFEVLQIGDVMVSPKYRGVFGRRGIFSDLAYAFIEDEVGARGAKPFRRFKWIYGFPNDRHLRIGEHLELYRSAGSMFELSCATQKEVSDRLRGLICVPLDGAWFDRNCDSFDQWSLSQTEALVRSESICLGRRHAAWWKYRFLSTNTYQVYGCSRGEQDQEARFLSKASMLQGLFALRLHQSGDVLVAELLDVLCEPQAWQSVFEMICRTASSQDAARLIAWATKPVALFLRHKTSEVGIDLAVDTLPFSIASGRWSSPWIDEQIWAMGGDTDFR
ncbi:MAG: hypothetical protein EB072_05580 [Betaproteobacteria bacterium]|nr:hypothetical protein [Betaproteobacteria bacterium]